MRRRPWPLVVLAFLHLLAPMGNLIVNAWIAKQEVLAYMVKALSPDYLALNWPILIVPLVAGFAIYACKPWSFMVYLGAMLSLLVLSYEGLMSKSQGVSLWLVGLVFILNIVAVAYVLLPAVRSIYFDRRLRWWEIQPRYRCFYRCQWSPAEKPTSQFKGVIGNISQNGLFMQANESLPESSVIEIQFTPGRDKPLTLRGRLVNHARADAIGFGVQFIHTPESEKLMKTLIRDLEDQGMRLTSQMDRPEDSLSYWLRTLLRTGRGLLPRRDK